jgi:hypothetical protein
MQEVYAAQGERISSLRPIESTHDEMNENNHQQLQLRRNVPVNIQTRSSFDISLGKRKYLQALGTFSPTGEY